MKRSYKLKNDWFSTVVERIRNQYRVTIMFNNTKKHFTLYVNDFLHAWKEAGKLIERINRSPDAYLLNPEIELHLQSDVKLAVQMA